MKTRYWIASGVIVLAGGALLVMTNHAHPTAAPATVRHQNGKTTPTAPKTKAPPKPKPQAPPIPKYAPTIPVGGTASGSATASFQAVTHQAPPVPLQVVSLPWQPTAQWAIEPLGMVMNGNATTSSTLWFGEKVGTSSWRWIPTTLPGQPSRHLPAPIRESLLMAYNLHLGEPGPTNTVGNITWQGLQGHVGEPVGWTLSTASANASPLFQRTVGVTLFQPSYTGSFSGYYGMEAAFDAQNATDGLHGLVGWVSRAGSLNTIVEMPPSLL